MGKRKGLGLMLLWGRRVAPQPAAGSGGLALSSRAEAGKGKEKGYELFCETNAIIVGKGKKGTKSGWDAVERGGGVDGRGFSMGGWRF